MINSKAKHPETTVSFCGKSTEFQSGNVQATCEALIKRASWKSEEHIFTQQVDLVFSGYNTFNTNSLRLWSALPTFEKTADGESDDEQEDIFKLLENQQSASKITS